MNKEWTYKDLEILRRDFPVLPCAELARKLGRTLQAVYVKANKLGLKKEHEGILWTPRMLKMLKDCKGSQKKPGGFVPSGFLYPNLSGNKKKLLTRIELVTSTLPM